MTLCVFDSIYLPEIRHAWMNARVVEGTGRMLSVRYDPKTTASQGNDDYNVDDIDDDDHEALRHY